MADHLNAHARCALWAKMGAGKTGVTLRALRFAGAMDEAPVLIIAPLRVARDAWPSEAEEWEGLEHVKVIPILGGQTARFQRIAEPGNFYSINFEMLPWLVAHWGKNWPYKTVVVDEATKLKGHRQAGQGGERTNALAKVAHRYVERFIELTGTPSPNGIKDLWGQLWFLDEGKRLGTSYDTGFKQRWFQRSLSGYGVDPLPFAQEQIQAAVSDICLTVDPADYLPLQPVIETDIRVTLPVKARAAYTEMEKRMFLELEHSFGVHEIEAHNAAGRTNKCLQLAAGAVYYDDRQSWEAVHDEKLDALAEVFEEACGAPVLISYIFQSDRARILKRFPFVATTDTKDFVKRWNKGELPGLAVHPASAGHGLSLQHGGNILVDFTSGWDLEYDDQVIERLGPVRQYQSGYDRPVYRYRIIADRTVDDLVRERRKSKRSVQDILLEAMKRR